MIKTRLIRLLPQTRKYIALNVLWQWMALITQIVIVFMTANMLERGMYGNINSNNLILFIVVVGIMLGVRVLCDRQAARSSYQASADVKRILREKIYTKLLRIGASYKSKISTSSVVQMIGEGVEQLEVYFGKYLPQLFYSLLAPVTLFLILSFISVKASVVLLICVPLIPASIVAVQKYAKRILKKYWGAYENLGDNFLENLKGLTTLKIYQADGHKAEEMDREAQNFRNITMKVLTMQLNSTSVMDIMAYGGAAVGMIVASMELMAGKIGFAEAIIIVLLASEFFIPLRLLGSFFHIAMNGMAASDRMFYLLDMEEANCGSEKLEEKNFDIEFKNVSFLYHKERKVLNSISLKLPKGNFVALVGKSGCGKSTVCSLIMKRNRGYEGEIKISGKELSDIQETEIMKNITMVSNNSYIFKGTVADNLRMGKEDVTEGEMIEVLSKVNLWEYMKQQQGTETIVLENGENFSGGQCQRLALARALLHDTSVYIFDEATSNIDAESEEMIMEVIRELAKTKAVLLISHRLANVVDADRIYMLEEGQIVEKGTHEELMQEKGRYHELFVSQKSLENYGKEGVVCE